MAFKKGTSPSPGNPTTPGRRLVSRVQTAVNGALDVLEMNHIDVQGKTSSELSVLILEALRKDFVGTIKSLSPILPKDVSVNVTRNESVEQIDDDELARLVAESARRRREREQAIEGEIIEQSTGTDG